MRAVILWIALLIVIPSVSAQNAPDVNTMPLDQLARAIANTINVSTVLSPNAPLTFDGASVQGTKVIVRFIDKDPALLAKAKAASDEMREALAAYFCKDAQRAASLKRGISLNYQYELADKSDRLEFTIDASACASLAAIKPASPSELAQLAGQVVSALQSDAEKAQQTQRGVTLKQVEAKDGVVEERLVVVVPAFESFYRGNIPQTRDMLKGYVCSRFGDSIRRGLRVHLVYEQFNTGAMLSEFNIGPPDC